MQYTTNYKYSLPESDDVLETASRVGYNNNFSDIDTQIKSTNDDIDSIGAEVDTISTQISDIDTRVGTLETNVGTRPSGETDTIWDKVNTLENRDIYSTTEQVIGKWIDGRPLYRRTFTGTTGSANSVVNLYVFEPETFAKMSTKTIIGTIGEAPYTQFSCNFYESTTTYAYTFMRDSARSLAIKVGSSNDLINKPCSVTIEYTKTTN